MIVADTNVLIYLFLNGPRTELALQLLEQEPQWLVPPLWRHEFHNVLVTHVQTARLTQAQAHQVWDQAVEFLGDSERHVNMDRVLELAVANKVSSYDAQFLALAEAHDAVCVSDDRALKIKAPKGLVKNLEDMAA